MYNRQSQLIEQFDEDLIEIDDDILETKSIYSIISLDIELEDIEEEDTEFIDEILEKIEEKMYMDQMFSELD